MSVLRRVLDASPSADNLLTTEWLVANGLGGYAAGTLAGAATRRYHGLLVAALNPPVERTVMVGGLVEWAIERGREARPGLKVGICGEHGGDPASVEFCHRAGLDYVSCSPYRVPIARLAAAQAALRERTGPANPKAE